VMQLDGHAASSCKASGMLNFGELNTAIITKDPAKSAPATNPTTP
jgi:hypothetical protein